MASAIFVSEERLCGTSMNLIGIGHQARIILVVIIGNIEL